MADRAMAAIRGGVAATRSTHLHALRVSGGDGAWETVSLLTSGELFLRDRQVLHSLWLDEEAHPIFDVYVLRDEESFVLLGESSDVDAASHARAHLRGGAVLDDYSATHEVISLNGPFAWELLGELYGPEAIGLPYLGAFTHESSWILRAGKTGEFGYDIIVPKDDAHALLARLEEIGPQFDLEWADLPVIEQCMLENWFFDIRREGRGDVTPLELQLQWRTSRNRSYVGSNALAARRAAGVASRLVTLVAPQRMQQGEAVMLFDARIGEVVHAGDALEGSFVALALVDVAWAHPGVELRVGDCSARSVTPPLPNNRSLFINLQQHSYATRDEIAFPPLFDR